MANPVLKKLEKRLKRAAKSPLQKIIAGKSERIIGLESLNKILIFRLDQRLGNGIMLLPLLRAMKKTRPEIEIHYLIHHPVASLFKETTSGLVDRYWPYNQPELMSRPWRYLSLLKELRSESFDAVFSINNPDNFSLSQGAFGQLVKAKMLVGFDARDSSGYYDLAIRSTTDKHYADSMVDLWREFDSSARCEFGGFNVSVELQKEIRERYPDKTSGILIWLGATKSKVLRGEEFETIYRLLEQRGERNIHFAAAPADQGHIASYPKWIQEKTFIWQHSLMETSAYFKQFKLFISADTGPMHLAVALRVPTLTLFQNSNMTQYGYQEKRQHYSIMLPEADGLAQVNKALDALL
ncbi:MAG: glycosyltransferase family 9 protein, partial [Calditrichota bacterium]